MQRTLYIHVKLWTFNWRIRPCRLSSSLVVWMSRGVNFLMATSGVDKSITWRKWFASGRLTAATRRRSIVRLALARSAIKRIDRRGITGERIERMKKKELAHAKIKNENNKCIEEILFHDWILPRRYAIFKMAQAIRVKIKLVDLVNHSSHCTHNGVRAHSTCNTWKKNCPPTKLLPNETSYLKITLLV